MKLLIAQQDSEVARLLKKNFESENFAVDIASCGQLASYLARTNDYDLIIIDQVLPKKSGLDVCQEIRDDKKTAPIIVLSAITETSIKIELLNAGADDYVIKPCPFSELLARIHALLRRPKYLVEATQTLDDLVLDSKKQSVMRAGRAIYLTRKEFMLLEYLLKNSGIVLSRGMIMEHVWDINSDTFSNTIESHIRSIRRKIDLPVCHKLIHTVSGRGYKIDLLD